MVTIAAWGSFISASITGIAVRFKQQLLRSIEAERLTADQAGLDRACFLACFGAIAAATGPALRLPLRHGRQACCAGWLCRNATNRKGTSDTSSRGDQRRMRAETTN